MMAADLLDRMRRNPAADWTIADVEKVCRDHGLLFRAGTDSHCHAKHPASDGNSDNPGPPSDPSRCSRIGHDDIDSFPLLHHR